MPDSGRVCVMCVSSSVAGVVVRSGCFCLIGTFLRLGMICARLCCHFLYPNQDTVKLRTLYPLSYNGWPLSWRGVCIGLSSKFLPSRSSTLRPWLRKAYRVSILRYCQSCIYFFMCIAVSLMVFFSRPVKSVNFSPSRHCRSQARLRCWKLVIWLSWVAIR